VRQERVSAAHGNVVVCFARNPPDPIDAVTTGHTDVIEFISVADWCKRVGCSLDAGYRAARRDEIPGLFRIGRLMRINWLAFVASTTHTVPEPPR